MDPGNFHGEDFTSFTSVHDDSRFHKGLMYDKVQNELSVLSLESVCNDGSPFVQ